jgi:phenylalanyl-tRNA synthetase beta chain
MRVPESWLREYCDPDLDVAAIEERLTMTGTKVEAIHHHGVGATEGFVVGRVLTCERHPDADRLSVCTVELGSAREEDGPATIVCGAPNVAADQTVAVALPGAVMPSGMTIKRAKLRGVVSEGMICAASELEIEVGGGDAAVGILVLDDFMPDADRSTDRRSNEISDPPAPGTPLADVLPIADEVIELEVTPNRPDCLGVYGVARELHAATGAPLTPEPWREDPGSPGTAAGVDISVECPDLCPRFTARVFEGVTVAPSPPWLVARLSAAGQRSINNVVDITNYAMLLTGQPLHAFDLDRIAGARLTVRRAHDGEPVRTLDGQTRTLDAEMVVIEDADGPTSIAGLMGGARSEVQPGTTRVLLEVANWHGPTIHRASWALGLRSEASSRFEKGLAPEQCLWAQAVASRLMVELCGATLLPGTIDIGESPPGLSMIKLRERRVEALLGIPIPLERQIEILEALGFLVLHRSLDYPKFSDLPPLSVEEIPKALVVDVPAQRRNDVTREVDLIEEVARIDGLERLPATLPARRGAYGLLSHEQRLRRRALDALVGRGCRETVGWTFTSPTLADRLRLDGADPRRSAPVVENPLSEEQSLLRTTLLGSLLDTAARNVARGISDLRLFEVGTVFAPPHKSAQPDARGGSSEPPLDARRETGIAEHRSLAVLLSGRLHEPSWNVPEPPIADFYAVKGMLEALASALRVDGIELASEPQPFLHPGRAAAITVGASGVGAGEAIGWLGELHPLVARSWELPGASVFEIDLDRLIAHAPIETGYEDLIGYPPLRQDLAVVLPLDVPAASVLAAARTAAGELLRDVRVFDVYTGEQVGEGHRSLALALSFRASDRTLADADIAPVRERIVAALGALGGELRGG